MSSGAGAADLQLGIVTPSLNQRAYLSQCLAYHQALPIKHLVSDGASTDGSLALLQAHQAQTSKGFAFISAADTGMYQALNRGFDSLDAPILGYINCDDLLLPWAPQLVVARFAQNPHLDLLVGDAIEWYPATQRAALVVHPPTPWLWPYLRDGGFLAQPSVFFRRRLLDKLGGFDEGLRLLGDHDFWLRAFAANIRVERIWEFLAIQRMSPEQLMRRHQDQAKQEAAEIRHRQGLSPLVPKQDRHSRALFAALHRFAILAMQVRSGQRPALWPQTRRSGLLLWSNPRQLRKTLFNSTAKQTYLRLDLHSVGFNGAQL